MIEVTATGRAALDRVSRCAEAHLAEVIAPLDLPRAQAAAGRIGRAAQGVYRRSGSARSNSREAKVVSHSNEERLR